MAGLLRERAVGHFLGLSLAADAYAAAFRIPNLLQNLLGEGVLSASFIPVQVGLVDAGRRQDAGRLAGTVLGLLSVVAGGFALLFVVGADVVVALLTPGKDAAFRALAADLLRIIAPGIALLVISAWCLGVLNAERQFFRSYVAPVAWNLAQVVVLVVAGVVLLDDPLSPPEQGDLVTSLARALAAGTVLGGLLQVLVQLPAVRRLLPGVRPTLGPITDEVRRVVRAFVPVVTGRGVVQLLGFLDLLLASLLAGTALATLQKVQLLALLPVSLFGMSVAAAELPELSGAGARDRDTLGARLDAGLARIAFYVLPSAVGFVVLGDLLVGAVLQTGAFDADDTLLVWVVLIGSCVGLVATTSSRLLQSMLYGAGDARSPARLAVLRVVVGGALGALLMLQLDRVLLTDTGLQLLPGASLPAFTPLPASVRAAPAGLHLGALGLTLASGLSAWLEFRLLRQLVELRLERPVRAGGTERRGLLLATAASVLTALAMRALVGDLPTPVAALLAVAGVAVVHTLVASALGVTEGRHLVGVVRRRVGR
jgi:putative peptidoglycan lipid II flippase